MANNSDVPPPLSGGFGPAPVVEEPSQPPSGQQATIWLMLVFGIMSLGLVGCYLAMHMSGWQPVVAGPK